MDIRTAFDAITPENIKDIPLIQTAMDIFVQNLENNAQIAENIRNVFQDFRSSDVSTYVDSTGTTQNLTVLQDAKANLRNGLLAVYLTALYNVLAQAQNNQDIRTKFAENGITESPFMQDVNRILNNEYFSSSKEFKERVGTITAFDYAYNLSAYLEGLTSSENLSITEVSPFFYRADGAIIKEMYDNVVKPLAHPVGFVYEYTQLISQTLSDIFGITSTYNVTNIEVRNSDGRFDVFTPDSTSANVQADFLTRVNPLTGSIFTLAEFNSQVTVYTNKVVQTFSSTVSNNRNLRAILFTDGTYLQQYTNPVEVTYAVYSNFQAGNGIVIKDYSTNWILYTNYTTDYVFQYTDDLTITSIYGYYLYSTGSMYLGSTDSKYLTAAF